MDNHNVTVYSTATCHYCVLLKDFLKQKGVSYKEIDVGANRDMIAEMVQKSGQMGVPVIDIDGNITVGFQPEIISKQLGIA